MKKGVTNRWSCWSIAIEPLFAAPLLSSLVRPRATGDYRPEAQGLSRAATPARISLRRMERDAQPVSPIALAGSDSRRLHLITSDRLERLADWLSELLGLPTNAPLAPEIVVVQSKGMEQWLRQQLALRLGVCAHVHFPFPRAFVLRFFRSLVPQLGSEQDLDPEVLVWRIMAVLPGLMEEPAFAALQRYLAVAPQDARRRVQLAGCIARQFDQYLVFRPDLVLGWSRGEGADWQARLWRHVWGSKKPPHPSLHFGEMLTELRRGAPLPEGWPARISIFGISALPPFYLNTLAALSERLAVHLFLLQPSQEYWGQVTSPREQERILRRLPLRSGAEPGAGDLHLEAGNRLLASLGQLGRDFLNLVLDAGDWECDECFGDAPGEESPAGSTGRFPADTRLRRIRASTATSEIRNPRSAIRDLNSQLAVPEASVGQPERSVLERIQDDLRHLRDRGRDPECPSLPLCEDDDSIRIHDCHSPLRELEVLRDHLMDWFQQERDLQPSDVVVMIPDLDTYAPLVEAVFGAPEEVRQRIPYQVADRSPLRGGSVIDAFLRVLDLARSRLSAPEVLGVLETPAVQRRFALTERDLVRIRGWTDATRIRWGRDSVHRAAWNLADCPGNTWREGIDRLLLGCTLAGGGEEDFEGILPYCEVEGEGTLVLGRFVEFLERLFATVAVLEETHTLAVWAGRLNEVIDGFFEPGRESDFELDRLREVLEELRAHAAAAGFDEPVALEAVAEGLRPALEEDRRSSGFLRGGVTFCGLKPMRSLPFRVICLIGMNDGVFPRVDRRPAFDLIWETPRLGDRSVRQDDRYLFLETLLSARRRLHISYVGQSVRDNRPLPPSVLVSELLDALEESFHPAASRREDGGVPSVRELLVVPHRLQAFHPVYFDGSDSRCFSYSGQNCRAVAARGSLLEIQPPLLVGTLPEPEDDWRIVPLEDVGRFFANPARYLLERRLKIFLREPGLELPGSESFVLDALEEYEIRQAVLALAAGGGADAGERLLKARGLLPLEAVGRASYQRIEQQLRRFHRRLLDAQIPVDLLESTEIALAVGSFHLRARLEHVPGGGPVLIRYGRLRACDQLRAWLMHLAWQAFRGRAAIFRLAGRFAAKPGDKQYPVGMELIEFAPVERPEEILGDLLALYGVGLGRLLKFFPETSWTYLETFRCARGEGASKALQAARRRWRNRQPSQPPPESEDRHFRFCFRETDPIDEEFVELARRVYGPLWEHRKETE